jgi:hypothetical protein
MKRLATSALVLAASLGIQMHAGSTVSAQDDSDEELLQEQAPELPPVTIQKIEAKGPGCLPGTWRPTSDKVGSDRNAQWIGIGFDEYAVFINPQTRSMTQNCELTFHLKQPTGIVATVTSVRYHGNVDLEPGVSAKLEATYYWSGRPLIAQSQTPKVLTGVAEDFDWPDTVNDSQPARCGGDERLVVGTYLTITNGTNPANGTAMLSRADAQIGSSLSQPGLLVRLRLSRCAP